MKTEKHKFFNDVETFVTWFNGLENHERKTFRMQVLQAVWPEKNRQTWYALMYGKMQLSLLVAQSLFDVAKQYDDTLTKPEQLFPTLTFKTMTNNIQKYLNKRGMTQAELSRQTGISKQSINLIVVGKQEPSVKLAQKIAAVLKCSVYDIFELEEADKKIA